MSDVDLAAVIDQARKEIADDPDHSLSLATRLEIFKALGPLDRYLGPGHRRRTRLAILAAEHVLTIWRAQWPAINIPAEALDLAKQVITNVDLHQKGWDFLNRAYEVLDNLQLSPGQRRALTAGISALVALDTARVDEVNLYGEGPLNDAEHGGPDEDAAGLAAIAFAGGNVHDANASSAQRLAFWTWYLDTAIPAV